MVDDERREPGAIAFARAARNTKHHIVGVENSGRTGDERPVVSQRQRIEERVAVDELEFLH